MARRPELPEIRTEHLEFLDEKAVLKDIKERRGRGHLQKLGAEAKKRGYAPVDAPEEVLGIRQRLEAREERRPPRGEKGPPVKDLEFELVMQSLNKPTSADQAALAIATIRAGKNTETYEMLLEAPESNFLDAREFIVEDDKVVEAESWWTAVWRCLLNKCGTVIGGALFACSGTFIAYVGCVLAAAGTCGVKCAACATCNCRWYCKWGVGCCSQ